MYGWIFRKVGWKFFAAGAATAYIGGGLIRPVLVSTVKAGLNAKDAAAGVWNQAKTETASVFADAAHLRVAESSGGDSINELRKLREDVAELKAQLASRGS
jgi:hypothetical protein